MYFLITACSPDSGRKWRLFTACYLLSSASTSSALAVVVQPTIRCGGNYVEGEVLLNFRQLQEEKFDEVCVNLSENVHTYVLPHFFHFPIPQTPDAVP